MSVRGTTMVLGGLLLAGAIVSGRQEGSRPAREERTPGDTLVAAITADIVPPLSAVSFRDIGTGMVLDLISPVMTVADFKDGVLRFEPAFAASWEWGEEGRTLTYTLREGVLWEEGQPVTAADVAFTYGLIRDEKWQCPRASFAELLDRERGVVALSPHRVRFRFTQAYDQNLQLFHTGHAPVPKHVFEKLDPQSLMASPFARRPKCEGPFTLASWIKGQAVILERNPRVKTHVVPKLERIVLQVHPDYAQRINLLEKGDVDLVDSIQFRDIARLAKLGTVKILKRGRRILDYVVWNLKDPLFESREVRRALTMAIDRAQLVNALLSDGMGGVHGSEAVSTFPPELAAFKDIGIEPLPHDAAKARELLGREGWKDGDGDGVLERGGKKLEFSLLVPAGSLRRAEAAVLLQSHLRRVGVSVNIETMDFVETNKRLEARSYQAALWALQAPLIPDPRDAWHSGKEHLFNLSGYANPNADALMDRGILERDPAKAAAMWRELAAMIYDEQPVTFLYWFDLVAAIHRRFQGVVASPVSLFHRVEEWWVPRAEQKHKD